MQFHKIPRLLCFLIFLLVASSCQEVGKTPAEEPEPIFTEPEEPYFEPTPSVIPKTPGYEDGPYQATVTYSNAKTGKQHTYKLEVEVANDVVRIIYFRNGGWLDETHIVSGGELDENGKAVIHTDKGTVYRIGIEKDQ